MHVAEQSLFINLARLLWGFNIELAKDENGETIPVDFTTAGLRPGFMSNPKPYRCGITPAANTRDSFIFSDYGEESAA